MPSEIDPKTLWERLDEDQASTWVETGESPVVVGTLVRLKDGTNWHVQKVSYARQKIRMQVTGKEECTFTSTSEVTLVSADDTFILKKMPVEAVEAELMNVPTLWERLGDAED